MQNAQSVVFGGVGPGPRGAFAGATEVRDALAAGADVLPVWRGKPLIAGAGRRGRSRSRSERWPIP
jgi:hypothetical protein